MARPVCCQQLLDLADIIEPGMTKWRGELLFETQATAVILTQRALDEGKVKNFQAQVRDKTTKNACSLTYLQSLMNTKLSQRKFWQCYENGLIKTIPTTYRYVTFK